MLTSAELARMQDDLEAATLPDTCNILSLTRTSDGEGGWSESWGTATASVKCRLDSLASRGLISAAAEQVQAASLKPYNAWILTLPHDTTITEQNRVEVGSTTYNVISVDAGKSWEANVRAMLEKT